MKYKDFKHAIHVYGIDLNVLDMCVGEKNIKPNIIGVYNNYNQWYNYIVNGNSELCETASTNEDEAFDILYRQLFTRINQFGYINNSITEDIIRVEKAEMFRFLKEKYGMNDWGVEYTWDILKHNFRVLNEAKYFLKIGHFVPESDAFSINDFTAEKIYRITNLNEIGAYNVLAYLDIDATQILIDLQECNKERGAK